MPAQCSLTPSSVLIMQVVGSMLVILSLIMCIAAIATLTYYRFYRSFNYRLILYLLISFLLDALTSCLIMLLSWYYYSNNEGPPFVETIICTTMETVKLYCMWNTQMFVTFMITEVFVMTVFSVELRKLEIPLTLACFVLPLAIAIWPAYYERQSLSSCLPDRNVTASSTPTTNSTDPIVKYCVIPGIVITGICAFTIATVISILACRSLRCRISSSSSGEEVNLLMHEYAERKKYCNALRETLPFTLYPIVSQAVLLILYLNVILCTVEVKYVFAFSDLSIGSVASAIFFIHIKTLGRRKRNIFRNRVCVVATGGRTKPINEGDRFVPVGSITATNVSHFDPPGESDVEPETLSYPS